MITLDIFNNDAFSVTTMLPMVNKMPFLPSFLGSLGIFESQPVATDTVAVSMQQGKLSLIRTTLRGAPIEAQDPIGPNVRPFIIPRVAKADKIRAAELANIVPSAGDPGGVQTVQEVLGRRQQRLIQDVEYTFENMRLGAVQGKVIDADGTTVLTNYWTEWGIAEPAAIDLNLDAAPPVMGALGTQLRTQIVRPLIRAGGASPATRLIGLAGDDFWDALMSHPEVRTTYYNWQAAADLRNQSPFETFRYGGIDWINYRGSDDNSKIAIAAAQAVIFPTGVPGMFQHVMGPGETFDTINRLGERVYPLIVRDDDRNMWVQPEIYAYPLMLNTRPDLVLKVKLT
jgi:hypothetical protein